MLDRSGDCRALTHFAVTVVMMCGGLLGVPFTVAASQDPVDYSDPATWLCRPDRDDACAVDQTTTVIDAAGGMTREQWSPDPDASIDCFYVYPTVSRERALNSSINAGRGERGVVVSQLARFASRCRLFAPLYRQITLAALMSRGGPSLERGDREMAYGDVLDAWNDYLARDNGGRGEHGAYLSVRILPTRPAPGRTRSAETCGAAMAAPTRSGGSNSSTFRSECAI